MSTTTDGRSTRWDEHRAQRRAELVDAALRAIRAHGATVGMDDIAAMAGTSKTVIYRHFTDRSGLYAAVAERVDALIVRDLTTAVARESEDGPADGRAVLSAAIEAYLVLVERDPEVYRFIVAAPLLERADFLHADDPGGVPSHVAARISTVIAEALTRGGHRPDVAPVWGTAVVGMVRAAADDWLSPAGASHGRPRERLREELTDLAWGGLESAWPSAG